MSRVQPISEVPLTQDLRLGLGLRLRRLISILSPPIKRTMHTL